ALAVETTSRSEKKPGSWLPDMVFRMRVLKAHLEYDNVVVEHTAGVGGEAAKVIGDTLLGILKQVKPSLEKQLLAKASAAIVKAPQLARRRADRHHADDAVAQLLARRDQGVAHALLLRALGVAPVIGRLPLHRRGEEVHMGDDRHDQRRLQLRAAVEPDAQLV